MTKNKVDIYIITDLLNDKHYVGHIIKVCDKYNKM